MIRQYPPLPAAVRAMARRRGPSAGAGGGRRPAPLYPYKYLLYIIYLTKKKKKGSNYRGKNPLVGWGKTILPILPHLTYHECPSGQRPEPPPAAVRPNARMDHRGGFPGPSIGCP